MPCDSTYVWHLRNKINGRTRQEESHRRRERFDGRGVGGRGEQGRDGEVQVGSYETVMGRKIHHKKQSTVMSQPRAVLGARFIGVATS